MSKADAPSADRRELETKLAPIGQEHLLAFWDRLDASERQRLARQLSEMDLDLFRELEAEFRRDQKSGGSQNSKWTALAARAEAPPAMRRDGSGVNFTADQARARGAE